MSNKPMGYCSLQAVIQFMEPNQRFLLAASCPSIRSLEKRLPLKIDELTLSQSPFSINGVKYELKVHEKVHNNIAAVWAQTTSGTLAPDFDKFGFREWNVGGTTILPGDVSFYQLNPLRVDDPRYDEELIADFEYRIRVAQNRLAQLKALEFSSDANARLEIQSILMPSRTQLIDYSAIDHRKTYRSMKHQFYEMRDERIKEMEHDIASFDYGLNPLINRKYNRKSLNEYFIQLTITYIGVQKRFEFVNYTGKLFEAEKSLFKFIFGKRKSSVLVKRLCVSDKKPIRFPMGLKLKIQEMSVNGVISVVCDSMKSVIDTESYPLEKFLVEECHQLEKFTHETCRTAKKLILGQNCIHHRHMWYQVFESLPNKIVHEAFSLTSHQDYVGLARAWIRNGNREVGTCFTFGFSDIRDVIQIFNMVRDQTQGAVMADSSITIPINNWSKLRMSYMFVHPKTVTNCLMKMTVQSCEMVQIAK